MTRRRAIVAAFGLLVLTLVLWNVRRIRDAAPPQGSGSAAAKRGQTEQAAHAKSAPDSERSTLADTLNSSATDIQADLRLVSEIITTFRSNLPHDGNPVGTNAEITAALTGKNRLRFAFVPADHPAINAAGELCDRWGTPFFFHAESATRMEIRSAGPDRKMWNEDDVAFSP